MHNSLNFILKTRAKPHGTFFRMFKHSKNEKLNPVGRNSFEESDLVDFIASFSLAMNSKARP